ncbi:MAG: 30S ribosomal protein S5 [Candidatus Aenigmarchaeota archaeon]|nr:30S ribosomal protein S5 [Candidatus Aenigmarchaeota archaeon]
MEENKKEDISPSDNEKKITEVENKTTEKVIKTENSEKKKDTTKTEIIKEKNDASKTEKIKKGESDEITKPETKTEVETKANDEKKPEEKGFRGKRDFKKGRGFRDEPKEEPWVPKTKLGTQVKDGKVTLEDIFKFGHLIKEPQITDFLIPDLEEELILIGGSPGKGGGIRRSMIRRTVRIHKSGRRLNLGAMVVVGNKNGYIGVGFGRAATNKEAIQKAARKARMNIFPIRRGCGSAECMCGEEHSIPFISFGKTGSVLVKLMPAPKGLKLCSPEEIKKMFRLAGIKDIRIKSRGQTGTRINFIYAVENALKNLSKSKL